MSSSFKTKLENLGFEHSHGNMWRCGLHQDANASATMYDGTRVHCHGCGKTVFADDSKPEAKVDRNLYQRAREILGKEYPTFEEVREVLGL